MPVQAIAPLRPVALSLQLDPAPKAQPATSLGFKTLGDMLAPGTMSGRLPALHVLWAPAVQALEPDDVPEILADAVAPPADAAEARERAETLLIPVVKDKHTDYGDIVRNAYDANDKRLAKAPLATAITKQIAANRSLEKTARAALSPADAARYDKLASLVATQAASRLALQLLLIGDQLTNPARVSQTGETMLATLATAADPATPLADGVVRADLLSNLVYEIAFPSAIAQKGKGTCTVTATEILVARTWPAEYARITIGLAASGDGAVTLADGTVIKRDGDTAADDQSRRTPSARLWQAAMMELADGPTVDYDNATDLNRKADGTTSSGLGPFALSSELKSLVGAHGFVRTLIAGSATALTGTSRSLAAAQLVTLIVRNEQGGHQAVVGVSKVTTDAAGKVIRSDGHEILIVKMDGDAVYYLNPWGQEERMSQADLTTRIDSVSFVDTASPAPTLPDLRVPKP